jgi:hypothetical protein
MKERLLKLQDHCLQDGLNRYDADLGLIGDYDPTFYTPEQLKSRFREDRFTARSLHPYRDSVTFALSLLFLQEQQVNPLLYPTVKKSNCLKDARIMLAVNAIS